MIIPIRYTRGAGNAALYVRLRNGLGQFWDFTALAWIWIETTDCRRFFAERADSDAAESLYVVDIAIPSGGPCVAEAVLAADGTVIGTDTTAIETTLSAVDSMVAGISTLLDIGQGDWQVVNNQMVFYTRGGSELMRFNLYNKHGDPTEAAAFRRAKV